MKNTLINHYVLPDEFDSDGNIFIEHYWWESFWNLPYGVVLLGYQHTYMTHFRTKFMAKRYAKRLAKKLAKMSSK